MSRSVTDQVQPTKSTFDHNGGGAMCDGHWVAEKTQLCVQMRGCTLAMGTRMMVPLYERRWWLHCRIEARLLLLLLQTTILRPIVSTLEELVEAGNRTPSVKPTTEKLVKGFIAKEEERMARAEVEKCKVSPPLDLMGQAQFYEESEWCIRKINVYLGQILKGVVGCARPIYHDSMKIGSQPKLVRKTKSTSCK